MQGKKFVDFEDARYADDVVYKMNNQSFCNKRTTVELAKEIPGQKTLTVTGQLTYTGAVKAIMAAEVEATP